MALRKLALVAVAALALAGCGSAARMVSTPATSPSPPKITKGPRVSDIGHVPTIRSRVLREPGLCPKGITRLPTVRIPSGLRVTAAFECATGVANQPDGSQWWADFEERATSGLTHLVALLARPDQRTQANIACATYAVYIAPFVLVEANGRLVRPRVPVDECGEPQAAARQALRTLGWKVIWRHLVSEMETPAERASGCGNAWKDLFDLYGPSLTPGAATHLPVAPSLLACAYRDTDPAINHPETNPSGADTEVGDFTGWARLSGAQQTTLLGGLDGGRTTATCSSPHTGFVVLTPSVGSARYEVVELGGCHRVLRMGYVVKGKDSNVTLQIGQATPAAITLLERLLSSKP